MAILFLILTYATISTMFYLIRESLWMLSNLFYWAVNDLWSFWFTVRKEKQLGKKSTRWKPRESSLFKLSKEEKTSFKQLLVSTIELLIFDSCLAISWNVAIWWGLALLKWYLSKRDLIIYCLERNNILRWCQLLILSRWRWIGIRYHILSKSIWFIMDNTY